MQGSGVCLASSISPMRRLEIGLAPDSFHRGVIHLRRDSAVLVEIRPLLHTPRTWAGERTVRYLRDTPPPWQEAIVAAQPAASCTVYTPH